MKTILRATRYLVALIVSIHVACLRGTCKTALKGLNKAVSNTDAAKANLRFAQETVSFARVNVREQRNIEAAARKTHSDTVMAADAEAKFWGRSL